MYRLYMYMYMWACGRSHSTANAHAPAGFPFPFRQLSPSMPTYTLYMTHDIVIINAILIMIYLHYLNTICAQH